MQTREVEHILFPQRQRRRRTAREPQGDGDASLPAGQAPTSPAPILAGPPVVRRDGDEFVFTWPEHGIAIGVEHVRETHGGLEGEILVSTTAAGDIHWGRLFFASTSGREGLVRKLEQVAPGPWRTLLDRVCRMVSAEIRAGAPFVTLAPASLPVYERFLVEPLLPENATAVLYGDGGVGKGWLAWLVALAVATGTSVPGLRPTRQAPVLYLDWESEEQDASERLALLAAGLGLTETGTILYRPMVRALADDIARIRAEAARREVGLVIVDSYTPACGKDPETAGAADLLFNALRSLAPASRLVIAHLSKAAAEQRTGTARPWGSAFVGNLARSAWEVRRSEVESEDLIVALFHRKANRGRLHPPLSLEFTFGEQAVRVRRREIADDPDFLARTPLAYRVHQALKDGAKTAAALAEELDAKENYVRNVLSRLRKDGKVIPLDEHRGKEKLWGLPARE